MKTNYELREERIVVLRDRIDALEDTLEDLERALRRARRVLESSTPSDPDAAHWSIAQSDRYHAARLGCEKICDLMRPVRTELIDSRKEVAMLEYLNA